MATRAMPVSRAFPPQPQVRYVASRLTVTLLDSLRESPDELRKLLKAWFPDVDEFDMRQLLPVMSQELDWMARVVEAREQRLLAEHRIDLPPAARR